MHQGNNNSAKRKYQYAYITARRNHSKKPFPGILQACGLTFLFYIFQKIAAFAFILGILFSGGVTSDMTIEAFGVFIRNIPPAIIMLLMFVVEISILILGLKLARRPVDKTLGFRSAPGVTYLVLIPIILGGKILISELGNVINAVIPVSEDLSEIVDVLMGDVFTGLIFTAFLGPILEEFIFRGIILTGLLKRYSMKTAYLTSAFLFAIIHLNIWQFAPAFIIGLFLAWLYQKTQSIWPCVFVHVTNNLIAVLNYHGALPFEIEGYNLFPEESVSIFQPMWFNMLGVVLLFMGILLMRTLLLPKIEINLNSQER